MKYRLIPVLLVCGFLAGAGRNVHAQGAPWTTLL